jgi:hypothetical protein
MKITLRNSFPINEDEASKFGGFMHYETCFCRIFDFENSPEKTLIVINSFLKQNGYDGVNISDLDEEFSFENDLLSISKHGFKEQLVLFINKDMKE